MYSSKVVKKMNTFIYIYFSPLHIVMQMLFYCYFHYRIKAVYFLRK